jgi:hypothetical protein
MPSLLLQSLLLLAATTAQLFYADAFLVPRSPAPPKSCFAALSESDKDRLLMGEIGMTAFIVAEMQHFVNETMVEFDIHERYDRKWKMELEDLQQAGLIDDQNGLDEAYLQATRDLKDQGPLAVEWICQATETAFREGYQQPGLLSALGSAISFFRNYYRTPQLLAACERVGLSDYQVAHHITDMYHHRSFRGAYTKTLPASGKGEIAARRAVGLDVEETSASEGNKNSKDDTLEEEEEEDECLLWSPTTPGVCLHWKSEDDAWRKKRFERIQMEGTRDPRRGGSGTTR